MSLATSRPGADEVGDVADIQISLLDGVGLTFGGVEIGLEGLPETTSVGRNRDALAVDDPVIEAGATPVGSRNHLRLRDRQADVLHLAIDQR